MLLMIPCQAQCQLLLPKTHGQGLSPGGRKDGTQPLT